MSRIAGFSIFAAIALFVALGLRSHGPGGDGVLARLTLPDGTECLVEQAWTGWTEPYTVDFFVRPSGGAWGWCYVDHEAERWREVELAFDAQQGVVELRNAGVLQAEYFVDRRTFALRGRGGGEIPAPQEARTPRALR